MAATVERAVVPKSGSAESFITCGSPMTVPSVFELEADPDRDVGLARARRHRPALLDARAQRVDGGGREHIVRTLKIGLAGSRIAVGRGDAGVGRLLFVFLVEEGVVVSISSSLATSSSGFFFAGFGFSLGLTSAFFVSSFFGGSFFGAGSSATVSLMSSFSASGSGGGGSAALASLRPSWSLRRSWPGVFRLLDDLGLLRRRSFDRLRLLGLGHRHLLVVSLNLRDVDHHRFLRLDLVGVGLGQRHQRGDQDRRVQQERRGEAVLHLSSPAPRPWWR